MDQIEHVYRASNDLGESPIWDTREQVLYWVDIECGGFHRFVPATRQVTSWDLKVPIGSFALRAGGGFVLATEQGFAYWNGDSQALEFFADPEPGKPDSRFNDGKVDRRGRFWAGTLAPGATSSLYRLDPDGSVHTMDTGMTVSNGLGWSPDNRTFYFSDSRRRVIYTYDFDLSTGEIANRRNWVVLADDEPGVPDGMAIDSEGCVWSCRWDGWKITRYDPDGKVEREIRMPIQRPTSCTFGGESLDTLYITSAWSPESRRLGQQLGYDGDLFSLQAPVKGLPETVFAG